MYSKSLHKSHHQFPQNKDFDTENIKMGQLACSTVSNQNENENSNFQYDSTRRFVYRSTDIDYGRASEKTIDSRVCIRSDLSHLQKADRVTNNRFRGT